MRGSNGAGGVVACAKTFDAARNPGDFPPIAEVRRASAYYYWAWSIAHVARHLSHARWAEALAGELLRRQDPDGSWRNPASEMREDDPIIAGFIAQAANGAPLPNTEFIDAMWAPTAKTVEAIWTGADPATAIKEGAAAFEEAAQDLR